MSRDALEDVRLLDAAGVADLLSVSVRTVWRWSATGDLPAPGHFAHGVTRWRLAGIRRWLHRRAGPRSAHRGAADPESAGTLGRVGT